MTFVTVEEADAEIEAAAKRFLAVRAELCRRSLKAFVFEFWREIEPKKELSWNWHHDVLCDELLALYEGRVTNEIINVPPGTMKTILASIMFRAWVWTKMPDARFLAASYGAGLSIDHNVKVRQIVQSPKYQAMFPNVRLVGDINAKERFATTEGGWSFSTSVGGAGTGEHPDFVLVDDPVTAQQARSDAERENANDWLSRTISTRGVVRGVRVLIIMQRLHEDDPTGYLLAKGGWRHLYLPMRFIPRTLHPDGRIEEPHPLDRRTEPGELLWPEVYPEAAVKKLEIDLGPYGAAGQLQQKPAPEGGGLFKRIWFRFISALPSDITRSCRGWDTAGTEDGGAYTVGVRIHERSDETYVIDSVVRGQWGPLDVEKNIHQTASLDGPELPQREEKEGGSAGVAVIAARAKLLKGYDYKGVQLTGDKVTRSKPFRAQVEAGNVFLLRTGDPVQDAWIEPYLAELSSFPVGTFKDQVDASATAFNQLLLEEKRVVGLTW